LQAYDPWLTAKAGLKFCAFYLAGQLLSDTTGLTTWLLEHVSTLQYLGPGVVSAALAMLKNTITNWSK